jgi:hypothetical protein
LTAFLSFPFDAFIPFLRPFAPLCIATLFFFLQLFRFQCQPCPSPFFSFCYFFNFCSFLSCFFFAFFPLSSINYFCRFTVAL